RARLGGPAPSEPRGHGPQGNMEELASSSLHPLKSWSLRETRCSSPSHGLPVSIGDPNGTKFAFSMLEAPQLESANSRTVVRVWQSWETGFSRWQARQVRSPWQSKYRTDL